MPINAFITGPIGVGKTTVCGRVVELARENDYTVAGILTPAIYDTEGQKTGIAIIDLSTGKRRILAEMGKKPRSLQVGRYAFDRRVLRWGCQALSRALGGGCDLFVVDEVGHLELNRGLGFTQALAILKEGMLPRALVVVRNSLLPLMHERVGDDQPVVDFAVSKRNRDQIPHEVYERLFRKGPSTD